MRRRGDNARQTRTARRRPQPAAPSGRRAAPQHSTFRRVAVFVPIEEPKRN